MSVFLPVIFRSGLQDGRPGHNYAMMMSPYFLFTFVRTEIHDLIRIDLQFYRHMVWLLPFSIDPLSPFVIRAAAKIFIFSRSCHNPWTPLPAHLDDMTKGRNRSLLCQAIC